MTATALLVQADHVVEPVSVNPLSHTEPYAGDARSISATVMRGTRRLRGACGRWDCRSTGPIWLLVAWCEPHQVQLRAPTVRGGAGDPVDQRSALTTNPSQGGRRHERRAGRIARALNQASAVPRPTAVRSGAGGCHRLSNCGRASDRSSIGRASACGEMRQSVARPCGPRRNAAKWKGGQSRLQIEAPSCSAHKISSRRFEKRRIQDEEKHADYICQRMSLISVPDWLPASFNAGC